MFFAWTAAEATYLYIKLVKVLGVDKYERGFTWKAGLVAWRKYKHSNRSDCSTIISFDVDVTIIFLAVIPAVIVIISLAGYQY